MRSWIGRVRRSGRSARIAGKAAMIETVEVSTLGLKLIGYDS